MKRSFLRLGLNEDDAETSIKLFEYLIRCESAITVTKTKWQNYVKDGNGEMEVYERAVLFDIMNRSLDAESEYLTILRKLHKR